MRLNYRNSEIHANATGPGVASIAHVFTDAHSRWVFAYCEMRDASSFWCHKYEDHSAAPVNLIFAMQPPTPWLQAVRTIPPQLRLAALQPIPSAPSAQKGGAA